MALKAEQAKGENPHNSLDNYNLLGITLPQEPCIIAHCHFPDDTLFPHFLSAKRQLRGDISTRARLPGLPNPWPLLLFITLRHLAPVLYANKPYGKWNSKAFSTAIP